MDPSSFLSNKYWAYFSVVKSAGPRLRMSGAIVLIPTYAFIAWTGTTLIFYHFASLQFVTSTCLLPILILHSRIVDLNLYNYVTTNTKKGGGDLFQSTILFLL
jgi:hypothetical protein